MANLHTNDELKSMQMMPLKVKVAMTKARIRSWINEFSVDGVYVSFSGGKDSTVLLDIVREDYTDVEAVYVDTGLEYPEIREFVKTYDNVTWLKPDMNFKRVIETYGYPFISKEVSNNVDGARRYLTEVERRMSIATDRQTDRQTDSYARQVPYSYNYRRICGLGEYAKPGLGQNKRKSTEISHSNGNVIETGDSDYP